MVDFAKLSIKSKKQQEAFKAIEKSNFNGIILATVGFGKGRVMCKVIEALYQKGCRTFLYSCDNTRLKDVDFPKELDTWLDPDIRKKISITMACYQTSCKWQREFDVHLADEFDFSITPVYIKTHINNKFKYRILLSGTLSAEKKKVAKQIAPIVYVFKMEDAEEQGVINKTEYFKYNFKMSDSESRTYASMTRKIATLIQAQVPFDDRDMQFWLMKRKIFLANLDSSHLNCRKILRYLKTKPNTRTVVFCESTMQADRVCDYSFHGKNEKDDNLTRFQNQEIDEISVVAKIQRGINLKNANAFVFEMMSGSTTRFEQKGGRAKRLEVNQVATVIFMIPWYEKIDRTTKEISWKPTIVEGWVEKATSNLNNINIKNLVI